MISKQLYKEIQKKAAEKIREAGIIITDEEAESIEVADFGLNNVFEEGAQILTLINTDRIAVKVIMLFPHQTEPEHWHETVGDFAGKEESIRVASGKVYFYVPGEDTLKNATIPKNKEQWYQSRHEIVMEPGNQITLVPGTKHWFQAGSEGAVLYSFSSSAKDELDKFTDPNIVRKTKIVE